MTHRRNVYLHPQEWKLLTNKLRSMGFIGRGSISKFLREIISPEKEIIFIKKDSTIKLTISKNE